MQQAKAVDDEKRCHYRYYFFYHRIRFYDIEVNYLKFSKQTSLTTLIILYILTISKLSVRIPLFTLIFFTDFTLLTNPDLKDTL